MNYSVVVVAAGESSRFRSSTNKLLYRLEDERTVIEHALDVFKDDADCQEIVVVTNDEVMRYLYGNYCGIGKMVYCRGGASRKESVFNGLMAIKGEFVLVHDGARCFLENRDLQAIKNALSQDNGAILCKSVTDTVKVVTSEGFISNTLDRSEIKLAQTPQGFPSEILISCYKKAMADNFEATDDAQVVSQYSDLKIKCVESLGANIKITYIEDVEKGS